VPLTPLRTNYSLSFGTFVFTLALPIFCGFLAVSFGPRITWDLLSYHYYNGYALVNNRLGYDIAPAGIQTYITPTLDALFYLCTQLYKPKTIQFALGLTQGVNLSLLFLLCMKTLQAPGVATKAALGICVSIVSLLSPGFMIGLGTTSYDNIVSVFVLLGLLILIDIPDLLENPLPAGVHVRTGIAGLIMGIGVGLKLTAILYAIGAAVALACSIRSWNYRVRVIAAFGVSGIIGALASGGYWYSSLWSHYQSPLFPFYNSIFQSAYISRDWRFTYYDPYIPKGFIQCILSPIAFSRDSSRVIENPFFKDIRFGLTYLFGVAVAIRIGIGKLAPKYEIKNVSSPKANFIIIFFIAAYICWMVTFSYYRYILPLELFIPLLVLLLLEKTSASVKTRTVVAFGFFASILFFFDPIADMRLDAITSNREWGKHYFASELEDFPSSDNTLVVMLGPSPMGYVIPKAPPQLRFIRPDWNYVPQAQQGKLYNEIMALLSNHPGTVYVLFNEHDFSTSTLDISLRRFNLYHDSKTCRQLKGSVDGSLQLCKLSRMSPQNVLPPPSKPDHG